MIHWYVTIASGSSWSFLDLKDLSGQYYELKSDFIEKLQSQIKVQPQYSIKVNMIQSAVGLSGEPLTTPFLLLLIMKSGLTVNLLGELSETNGGQILGVWPDQFREVFRKDPQSILNLLFSIIEHPEVIFRLELFF